jgi:hypothetical protein
VLAAAFQVMVKGHFAVEGSAVVIAGIIVGVGVT